MKSLETNLNDMPIRLTRPKMSASLISTEYLNEYYTNASSGPEISIKPPEKQSAWSNKVENKFTKPILHRSSTNLQDMTWIGKIPRNVQLQKQG